MSVGKNTIRPYYSEFQGYLAQAPTATNIGDLIYDDLLWKQYNDAVGSLSTCANLNYSRFRIDPTDTDMLGPAISVITYRQKLGGLISRLHATYFSDEPAPFSGMPSTIIHNTQQQSVNIQMILDIQSKIDEVITKTTDEKEKGFLNKFKGTLSSLNNINDILSMCMKLAKDYGLSIQDLISLWS
jgi:hypothetical protein